MATSKEKLPFGKTPRYIATLNDTEYYGPSDDVKILMDEAAEDGNDFSELKFYEVKPIKVKVEVTILGIE